MVVTSRFIHSLSIAAVFPSIRLCGAFAPHHRVAAVASQSEGACAGASAAREPRRRRHRRRRGWIVVASRGGIDDDEDEVGVVVGASDDPDEGDDAAPLVPIVHLFGDDVSSERKKVPSMTSQVTLAIFKLFSYCIQFLGGFFFLGLLLNLSGFGYTFDLDRGLVIDRIGNIRNEVQFEREIEREGREDAMKMGGGGSIGGSRYIIGPEVPKNDVDPS
jgi:hypothetical protein